MSAYDALVPLPTFGVSPKHFGEQPPGRMKAEKEWGMSETSKLDAELNQMILAGKALDAFEKYYADDVVMQENTDEPRSGKEINRKYEQDFFASVEEFHGAEMSASAINDDTSFSQWMWDVTLKGMGRIQLHQVAVRKWRDGKVAHERFFYNKG